MKISNLNVFQQSISPWMPVSGFASEKWKFKPILLLLLFFFSQRGRPLLVVIGDIESEVVGHLMTDSVCTKQG